VRPAIAVLPVAGPIDVVKSGVTGVLDDDLGRACMEALKIDRNACRSYAESRSWRRCTEELLSKLAGRFDVADQGASLARGTQ
jgi:hypothetical protein